MSARDELTELLRWIDVEMGTDVPEVSVPLRRIVARSPQLELIAQRARDVIRVLDDGGGPGPVGPLINRNHHAGSDALFLLAIALIDLDNHPATRKAVEPPS